MLKAVRIQNFKCLRDTGEMELRPLTLLIGTNSSGKSSVLQGLACLFYNFARPALRMNIPDSGLELGSFADVVYNHDTSNPLSFSLTVSLQGDVRENRSLTLQYRGAKKEPGLAFLRSLKISSPKTPLLEVRFRESVKEPSSATLNGVVPSTEFVSSVSVLSKKIKARVMRKVLERYIIHQRIYRSTRKKGFFAVMLPGVDPLNKIKKEIGQEAFQELTQAVRSRDYEVIEKYDEVWELLPEEDRKSRVVSFLEWYVSAIREAIRLYYLGPLRMEPKRAESVGGEVYTAVGFRGELTPQFLVRRYSQVERMINRWIRWLDVGARVVKPRWLIKKLGRFEVIVKDERHPDLGLRVSLKDVGFGIPQVLPVLLQGAVAEENSVLLLEQPEIHLHPKSQAAMGEVLADMAGVLKPRTRPPSRRPPRKILLIETHSDLIVARISRLIAEERLSPKDCIIHYFDPTDDGTVVRQIYFDEEGAFFAKDDKGEEALEKFLGEFLGSDYSEFMKTIEAVERARMRRRQQNDK